MYLFGNIAFSDSTLIAIQMFIKSAKKFKEQAISNDSFSSVKEMTDIQ
jgi:hypothetical protein